MQDPHTEQTKQTDLGEPSDLLAAYERSLMRAQRRSEGLNVTTRRAETVAAIPVFGNRCDRCTSHAGAF